MGTVSKSLSIPADLLLKAEEQAHIERTTFSALAQKAIEKYLNSVEQKQRRRA
jgi:hypothetical protein